MKSVTSYFYFLISAQLCQYALHCMFSLRFSSWYLADILFVQEILKDIQDENCVIVLYTNTLI